MLFATDRELSPSLTIDIALTDLNTQLRQPQAGRAKVSDMSNLLELDRLVISQKAKLIELTNQYMIHDEAGNDVGYIQQEGQSKVRKALRFVSDFDQFLTHRLAVYDASGTKLIELVRPGKVFKSRLEVTDGVGRKVGQIVQKNVFGKIRFDLVGDTGVNLGQIRAENWRAWNFAIVDDTEREIARITKKWKGLVRATFTTADHYIVEIEPSLQGDTRLLVVGAAAAVDTALKQDDRGLLG